MIPVHDVFADFFRRARLSFARQFAYTSEYPHIHRSGEIDFQFGIGKYHGSNVATVHDNATFFAHFLLHSHQFFADAADSGDFAHHIRHAERTDFLLDVDAIEEKVAVARFWIQPEIDVDFVERSLQNGIFGFDFDVVFKEIQGYSAVHRTGIDKQISEAGCNSLGGGGLSGR
jgi:hypothetical protein